MKHVSCAYKRAVATECITKINTPSDKQQPFHCLQQNNTLFVYEGLHTKAKVEKNQLDCSKTLNVFLIDLKLYVINSVYSKYGQQMEISQQLAKQCFTFLHSDAC